MKAFNDLKHLFQGKIDSIPLNISGGQQDESGAVTLKAPPIKTLYSMVTTSTGGKTVLRDFLKPAQKIYLKIHWNAEKFKNSSNVEEKANILTAMGSEQSTKIVKEMNSKNQAFLGSIIDKMDPVNAAKLLISSSLEVVDMKKIMERLSKDNKPKVLAAMDPEKAALILAAMDSEKAALILAAMDSEKAAPILKEIKNRFGGDKFNGLLEKLDENNSKKLKKWSQADDEEKKAVDEIIQLIGGNIDAKDQDLEGLAEKWGENPKVLVEVNGRSEFVDVAIEKMLVKKVDNKKTNCEFLLENHAKILPYASMNYLKGLSSCPPEKLREKANDDEKGMFYFLLILKDGKEFKLKDVENLLAIIKDGKHPEMVELFEEWVVEDIGNLYLKNKEGNTYDEFYKKVKIPDELLLEMSPNVALLYIANNRDKKEKEKIELLKKFEYFKYENDDKLKAAIDYYSNYEYQQGQVPPSNGKFKEKDRIILEAWLSLSCSNKRNLVAHSTTESNEKLVSLYGEQYFKRDADRVGKIAESTKQALTGKGMDPKDIRQLQALAANQSADPLAAFFSLSDVNALGMPTVYDQIGRRVEPKVTATSVTLIYKLRPKEEYSSFLPEISASITFPIESGRVIFSKENLQYSTTSSTSLVKLESLSNFQEVTSTFMELLEPTEDVPSMLLSQSEQNPNNDEDVNKIQEKIDRIVNFRDKT